MAAVAAEPMSNASGTAYLESLIGRTLSIAIRDGRTFVGTFKCTDRDMNVILAASHEYRQPSEAAVAKAAAEAASSGSKMFKADMPSRYVGLIVLPGDHIERIELEEYVPPKT